MKKTLNKFLKFLGFNVVKAKRPRARKTTPARIQVKLDTEGLKPYDADELRNHVKTHYVGDDCPGGHRLDGIEGNSGPIGCAGHEISRVEQPKSDNNVTGQTS